MQPGNFNIPLPSYSTIKKHIPNPHPYQSIEDQTSEKVRAFKRAYMRCGGLEIENKIPVIFTLDEVSLRSGLLVYKNIIVDQHLSNENYEQYLQSLDGKPLSSRLAESVLGCFMTSLDGLASIPLFTVPTIKASVSDHLKYIKQACTVLSKYI